MSRAIRISLAVHAVLGLGWLLRAEPAPLEVWPLAGGWFDAKRLQFSRAIDSVTEQPMPWTATRVAIRIEDAALYLVVDGSLEHPETWRPHGTPVVYVYPDADVTVGDVVAALDRVEELVPRGTIVVTELVGEQTTQPGRGGGDAPPP